MWREYQERFIVHNTSNVNSPSIYRANLKYRAMQQIHAEEIVSTCCMVRFKVCRDKWADYVCDPLPGPIFIHQILHVH